MTMPPTLGMAGQTQSTRASLLVTPDPNLRKHPVKNLSYVDIAFEVSTTGNENYMSNDDEF